MGSEGGDPARRGGVYRDDSDRLYEARLDSELAELDRRPTPTLAPAPGQRAGSYVGAYLRRILPIQAVVGALYWLRGGSFAGFVVSLIGTTVIVTVVGLAIWVRHRP